MGAFCTATHYCNTRQHTATYCNTLHSCTAGPPNKVGSILYDEGVNTLQHTATHYTHVNDSPPSTEAIQGKKKGNTLCRKILPLCSRRRCNTLQHTATARKAGLFCRRSPLFPQQCRVLQCVAATVSCVRQALEEGVHVHAYVIFVCNTLQHTATHCARVRKAPQIKWWSIFAAMHFYTRARTVGRVSFEKSERGGSPQN